MNLQAMRRIDFYGGAFICLVLDAWERLLRLFSRRREPVEIRSILVTKYLGMGSILLATPALRALRSRYPDSRIVFLTFEGNAAFARKIGVIDEVLSLRTSSFALLARDLLRTILRLRREKFDVAFDFEFFARFSTIVSYLSGASMRVGYYLPKLWRGDLLTHQIHFNPYRHVTEVFAAQLQPFGIRVDDFTLMPPQVGDEAERRVAALLKEKGVAADERIVVVNVNASDLSTERRWPKEYFAELLSAFAGEDRVRFVLVGSGSEAAYVRGLYGMLDEVTRARVLDLSGQLGLEEFVALIRSCSLCITNDSGPLHMAAALGRPTVSFFGPESPKLYGPVGDNHSVFYADIYCSPCLNVYNAKRAMCNGDNRCMQAITPAEVIGVLKEKGIL